MAYNVYISSELGFLAQLEHVPNSWNEVEATALRRLLPGPGGWIFPRDVHRRHRDLSFPLDVSDLSKASFAAKLRSYYREILLPVACRSLQIQ